ncbi:hypothetical protein [Paraburkholderia elongata]|uniref:Uncharacterized protein n=1 Tax=Paraburkholderia elongata TaxID=2675747 RepID=A0A972NVA0_9BURK|nr:hypothetical protein [Paraburkholderia elongata]NPT59746.1 hypothetical protein [Paraburkholderia elongata]
MNELTTLTQPEDQREAALKYALEVLGAGKVVRPTTFCMTLQDSILTRLGALKSNSRIL